MTKEKDTSLRMAALRQNLARKNSIPFNSSTPAENTPVTAPAAPAEQVKAQAPAPVAAPVAPAELVKVEAPAPVAAPVAPAEKVKAETSAPVTAPVKPIKAKSTLPVTPSKTVKSEAQEKSAPDGTISIQQSVSFNEAHHEIALLLAAKIGCATEDIVKLVAKDIQVINVDPDDTKAEKRAGQSKRLSLKFNQSEIDNIRAAKDPLNVKTDVILVRNSVLNYFDSVAETVLAELKLKHGI